MRVLQVFSKMDCGGAELFLMNIYRRMDRSKIQFDFVVHNPEEGFLDKEIRELGGHIFVAPDPKKDGISTYKRWWKNFLDCYGNRYGYIHAHFMLYGRFFCKYARKHNIKTILHSHSNSCYKGFDKLLRKILYFNIHKKCNYQFACSVEAGRKRFGKKIHTQDTFFVVKNGIEMEQFRFCEEKRKEIRSSLKISDNQIVVGHVGRFVKEKNHIFLLEIFQKLTEISEQYQLLLIGDGPLRAEIEKRVKKLGLENNVLFLGVRADVHELINAMDIFLFPSISEGLPLSIIEAQVNGLPIYLSNNITEECVLTDVIRQESLAAMPQIWAKRIADTNINRDASAYQKMKESGFDGEDVVVWISKFYLGDEVG